MKNIYPGLVALFIYMTLVDFAFAESGVSQDKAESEVAHVVQQMFDALSTGKFEVYNKLVTPDFYLYDLGERLAGDTFLDLIKKGIAKGMKYDWRVTEPDVHISGNLAWIAYTNHGSFESDKGKQQKIWLESAVLELQGKTWRIRFLHSTLVPK